MESAEDTVDHRNTRDSFERRLQSVIQAIILAILLGIGYAMIDLVKSSSRQEVTNLQTSRDIGDLKSEISVLRIQITNTAITASNAAAAAASAASASVAAATQERKRDRRE